MTSAQKIIKYLAIAFAIFLIFTIVSVILNCTYKVLNITGIIKDSNEKNQLSVISDFVDEVSSLKIDLDGTDLEIRIGETFKVETNNPSIKYNNVNGNIVLTNKSKLFSNDKGKLIIYMPQNMKTLDNFYVEAGAGTIVINMLKTQNLYFELGAGKVKINNLEVTREAKIEGGAGKININSATINNLDLEMGVGELTLEGNLIGKSEIAAGIGNINIKLNSDKTDYKFKVDKGLGNIKIDDEIIKGETIIGNGYNYLDVEGGIGNINIEFNR